MGHLSQEELVLKIDAAKRKVVVGGRYVHYKNTPRPDDYRGTSLDRGEDKYYVVEFVGVLESSEEVCVGYRASYGKGILWVRTVENFLEEVEVEEKKTPRFVYVK